MTTTSPVLFSLEFAFRDSNSRAASGVLCGTSGISVQTRQQVRDSEERKHHHGKSANREVRCHAPAHPAREPHVKVAGINDQGGRGPGLLRVPATISTKDT